MIVSGQDYGTWVLGDTLTDLRYPIKNRDGTAFDLTAATITLIGVSPTTARTRSIAGTAATPTNGIVVWSDLTAGITFVGTETSDRFICYAKIVQGGKTGYSRDAFAYTVRKFP